jgi:hypothetical protein
MVTGGFNVDVFTTERVSGPINCRIEGFEPRVSQDDSVMTNVGDEETSSGSLGSSLYPEVGILSYGACAVSVPSTLVTMCGCGRSGVPIPSVFTACSSMKLWVAPLSRRVSTSVFLCHM